MQTLQDKINDRLDGSFWRDAKIEGGMSPPRIIVHDVFNVECIPNVYNNEYTIRAEMESYGGDYFGWQTVTVLTHAQNDTDIERLVFQLGTGCVIGHEFYGLPIPVALG